VRHNGRLGGWLARWRAARMMLFRESRHGQRKHRGNSYNS
jgi:hypothetical protein